MKFNYKLHRLCGSSYGTPLSTTTGGSNLLYTTTHDTLLSPVSNRIQCINLLTHSVRTLPFEARSDISKIALCPNDTLLLCVDVQDRAVLLNYKRGVVLHRFRFKGGKVRCIEFSPCGLFFAVSAGKHVQVWHSPSLRREFAPFVLHRTYTGLSDDVVDVEWSKDSSVILAGGRDGMVRIWTVQSVQGYEPVTLSGHKSTVMGVFLEEEEGRIRGCFTVSEDGALCSWKCEREGGEEEDGMDRFKVSSDSAVDFFSGGGSGTTTLTTTTKSSLSSSFSPLQTTTTTTTQAQTLQKSKWSLHKRHYFPQQQNNAIITSTSYSPKSHLLVLGFSTGLFALYELPSVSNIHTLSISTGIIRTTVINPSGEWIAFGCPSTHQLLVWEWRSETYVLKQRGHAGGMKCMSYSPDGVIIATGGEDGTLKLWNANTGFCHATLDAHSSASVTSVKFANSSVVLTSSLDGTIKAHDLHRYKTFRTYTTPNPAQFISLAVDRAGEVIAGGTADPFHIYIYSLQSGQLLDIMTEHAGPVCDLSFHPVRGTMASVSWDGTAKVWDLYKREVATEEFGHSKDVVCCDFRPDGDELCTGTIGGILSFWNVESGDLRCEIDGQRDIAGGRKVNDRMTANNNAASRYFTSVCYSADGNCVIAGGNSKYVCIYEISQQMLLKKFQISFNRSLDGVLDELNSKNLGDGGPIDEMEYSGDEAENSKNHLPGAKRKDDGSRKSRVEVLTMQVAFSSTGREWATVSNEGLHVYSLDDDMIFDPISLTEAVTPGAVQSNLRSGQYGTALVMSLHLNEFALVKQVIEDTPYGSIPHVVRSVGPEHLERLLQFVSKCMSDSPHVEFYVQWCLELLQTHGMHMEKHRGSFMRAFRAMHKTVQTRHDELKSVSDNNRYTLDFMEDQTKLLLNVD